MEWRKRASTHYPQDQAESFGSPRARYWREEKEIPYHPAGDPTIHGMRLPPQPNQEGAFHPLGKNPGDLWTIPTQPAPPEVRGKHFATFPEKLIEPMILAGCPPNGIVLDPFAGSCTSAVVAKRLGRNYIMIELNPQYCEVGKKRLEKTPSPLPDMI
jgi:DNA modification methylase